MSDNGNHPEVNVAEKRSRVRGSGPILILAVLFVAATFLAWYFTWFGRELSEADISKYLADERNPRHVQHALLQIQQRIDRNDSRVKNWYPQIIHLSQSSEAEFRLTSAWLMGFDNRSTEFHDALLKLVHDEQPIVRRNAALALVRFNDPSGREEIVAILKPYSVNSPAQGTVASTLHEDSSISRGALLARIQQIDGKVIEVRSPLPGKIAKISKGNGSQVIIGDELLRLNSDEESVWEALRGLALVGTSADLEIVKSYSLSNDASSRVKEQAALTARSIESRKDSRVPTTP